MLQDHLVASKRKEGVGKKRGIALLLAFMLSFVSLIPLGAAAQAATEGIESYVTVNGQPYTPGQRIKEGDQLKLAVKYTNKVTPGSDLTVTLGDNVTVSGTANTSGNEALQNVVVNGNSVTVKFADPFPPAVNQGVFYIDFTMKPGPTSGETPIKWEIGPDESTLNVIVIQKGDTPENVTTGYSKAVAPGTLGSHVNFNATTGAPESFKDSIDDAVLTYTLKADVKSGKLETISDVLPAGLSYVNGSFAAQLTTWDANGLNMKTEALPFVRTVVGNTFSGVVDKTGPLKAEVTYQVKVSDKAALLAALQDAYDNTDVTAGSNKAFDVKLTNTATYKVDGVDNTRPATVTIAGTKIAAPVPGPGTGAFVKNVDVKSQNVTVDTDGNLTTPIPVVYTLTADMTMGVNGFVYDKDVVISDTLPATTSWDTSASDFLTVTAGGITLSQMNSTDCTATTTLADMQDAGAGKYCVVGQKLLVNVGKTGTVTVNAKANITKPGTLTDGKSAVCNTGIFNYADGKTSDQQACTNLTTPRLLDTALAKSANWVEKNVVADATGKLTPPADVIYTLTADLTKSQGGFNFTDNVVLSDELPAQATWKTTDSEFITAGAFPLTKVTTCDANTTPADFATSAVGSYCVTGKTLLVNVGQDSTTVAVIKAKATIDTTAGLETTTTTSANPNAQGYKLTNTVKLHHGTDTPKQKSVDNKVVVLPVEEPGWNDTAVFEKKSLQEGKAIEIEAGQTTKIDYAFKVGAGKGIDLSKSRIVDTVDTTFFNITNLAAIKNDLTATYNGKPFDTAGIDVTIVGGNQLTFALNASGVAKVIQEGVDKEFKLNIKLETNPIEKRTTNQIKNSAKLVGEDLEEDYYDVSSVESSSYGSEVEIQKNVYDKNGNNGQGEWVNLLKVETDAAGNLVQDTYVYRVKYIPRKGFSVPSIAPIVDNLPNTVEFVGFVDPSDVANAASPSKADRALPDSNLVATYATDASGNETVTIKQGAAQFGNDKETAVYIAVKVKDLSKLDSITNRIDSSEATIDPVTYAIGDYTWIDTNKNGKQDPGEPVLPGVKVELLDKDGKVIGTTTTDKDGFYIFDKLPSGEYQVKFTLTEEQAKKYQFTQAGAGSDGKVDSNADVKTGKTITFYLGDTNKELTRDYTRPFEASEGIDPTWDAGVVEIDDSTLTNDPKEVKTTDPKQPEKLKKTGASVLVAGLSALALIGAGGVLVARRRDA